VVAAARLAARLGPSRRARERACERVLGRRWSAGAGAGPRLAAAARGARAQAALERGAGSTGAHWRRWRKRESWSGWPRARGGAAGAGSSTGVSGMTQEQEWSPGPGSARVGGAGARGGAAGVELRRTRLEHVQVRRGKVGANAGPAAGRGGAAARTCRAMVCRENTRGTGGAAVWRLRAEPHGSSRATCGERRRPSRRRQRKART
jgi:hypothetical protein